MDSTPEAPPRDLDANEPIPRLQRLYDSPFLLLLLGVGTMALFYTIWGIAEILRMPPAPLP